MKSKFLCLILFCCFAQILKAQDKGMVIFNIAPLQATIKINDQLLKPAGIGQPKTSIELVPGKYKVEVWAFGMEYYEEDITVKASETITIAKILKIREDCTKYNTDVDAYYQARKEIRRDEKFRLIPFYFGIYCVLQTSVNLPLIKEYETRTKNLRSSHPIVVIPLLASNNRVEYESYQRKYKTLTNFQYGINYIGVPIFLGLSGYVIYSVRNKYDLLEKPIFNDESPFSNVDFNFDIQPSLFENDQDYFIVLTYNF